MNYFKLQTVKDMSQKGKVQNKWYVIRMYNAFDSGHAARAVYTKIE